MELCMTKKIFLLLMVIPLQIVSSTIQEKTDYKLRVHELRMYEECRKILAKFAAYYGMDPQNEHLHAAHRNIYWDGWHSIQSR